MATVGEFELEDGFGDDLDGVEPVMDDWMQMSANTTNISRQADITLESTPQSKITLNDDTTSETWTAFNDQDEPFENGAEDSVDNIEVQREKPDRRESIRTMLNDSNIGSAVKLGSEGEPSMLGDAKVALEEAKADLSAKRDSVGNLSADNMEVNQSDLNVSAQDEPEIPAFEDDEMPEEDMDIENQQAGNEQEEMKVQDENGLETTVVLNEKPTKRKAKKQVKKRKRKVLLDGSTVLSHGTLRKNLANTSDIVVLRIPVNKRICLAKAAVDGGLNVAAFSSCKDRLKNPGFGSMHPSLVDLYQLPLKINRKRKRPQEAEEIEAVREAKRASMGAQNTDNFDEPEFAEEADSPNAFKRLNEDEETSAKLNSESSLGASAENAAAEPGSSLNVSLEEQDMPEFEDTEFQMDEDNAVEEQKAEETAAGGEEEFEVTDQIDKAEKEKMVMDLLGDGGSLFAITEGRNKKTAAAVFYKILELKTKDEIHLVQEEPFADIHVTFKSS